MAFLKVYTEGEERTVFLGDEPVLFGRGDDVDCLIRDAKVSRQHCVIEPAGTGRWQVRDLGSGNGTKVNGAKIDVRVLEAEDAVQVGDARILFAGEAVAVVEPATDRPREPRIPEPANEGNGRRLRQSKPSKTPYFVIGFLVLAVGTLAVFFSRGAGPGADREENAAYRSVIRTDAATDRIQQAEAYLLAFPSGSHAGEVKQLLTIARRSIQEGTDGSEGGYDPAADLKDLPPAEAIQRLEAMLGSEPKSRHPAIQRALEEVRQSEAAQRESFFAGLETIFRQQVSEGEYARAREMWFFLRGDPDWSPMPDPYVRRIIDAMVELENSAASERSRLFNEVSALEAAHQFAKARDLLVAARPRFAGTSVVRSFDERLDFVSRALKQGAKGTPRTATPVKPIEVDLSRKADVLLKELKGRDYASVALGLRALMKQAKSSPDAIVARTREVEAAAALQATLVKDLAAGKLPKNQLAKRWRVVAGDEHKLTARSKGSELSWPWAEVPHELYFELLLLKAAESGGGPLGLTVIAHAACGKPELNRALELGYANEKLRPLLDAFVAARVRDEPVPDGGYVVFAGDIWRRKEYLRKQEEQLIAQFRKELDEAHGQIKAHKAFKKLAKLSAKKDDLDKAREFALELIFDEKKYFYPYRGSGRMGEYNKVQQEVDRRVAAVRELWDDRTVVAIKGDPKIRKTLENFDKAAAELGKRLVDVDDKVEEVAFLRSYLGAKFNIRNFFRDPEERFLMLYSAEVMEFNPTVKGDITDPEREQVRVTNEYRMMFGRWPVRMVEKLTLSSRGHCEEMNRLGYFGHFSPTPGRRTPYDRMKLQGYQYGSSENCAAGSTSPLGAHQQWCHSSGHHRNLLMAPWTEMGSGQYGRLWTQNFGRAPKWSKHDEPEEKEEPGRDDGLEFEPWDPSDYEDGGDEAEPGKKKKNDTEDDEDFDYGD